MQKIANPPPLPDGLVLCTIDLLGIYLNIPYPEGLIAIRKALDTRKDQTISTDYSIELAERVLENNIFKHNNSIFKQLRGTAIENKITPSDATIFMDSLEEEILNNNLLKPLVGWCYMNDIFMMWEHG